MTDRRHVSRVPRRGWQSRREQQIRLVLEVLCGVAVLLTGFLAIIEALYLASGWGGFFAWPS